MYRTDRRLFGLVISLIVTGAVVPVLASDETNAANSSPSLERTQADELRNFDEFDAALPVLSPDPELGAERTRYNPSRG